MASQNKSIKLGLIGCGRATEILHLPALSSLPDAEVLALTDIDPARLNLVAGRFHIPLRHSDYQTLLKNPDIDAVAVCVPPQFHVEVALAVIDAGKHLLIEKPLALSLEESDRLIQRARQAGTKTMMGFNLRWHRLVRQARTLLRQNSLGTVESIRTVLTSGARYAGNTPEWRRRRKTGGGVLFDMAVHHFDLWRFLLETDVEEVFATSRSGQWDDEMAMVTARLANGASASSVFSMRTVESNELELFGEAGRLNLSCYRFDGFDLIPSSSLAGGIRNRMRRISRLMKDLPRTALTARQGGDFLASYRSMWRHFLECVQRNTIPECGLEDGRLGLQVVLAATESACRGRPIRVVEASGNKE